ncbi:universal stress protein [Geodermatophilus sp. TF02-6]|uniref:universal stress protein n=1 Tax=Geodermatophilus sp. TF02-6 TaxID=2250575 RepID=UPI000DEB8B03|nr:universal stress protein [Geodermatophilus sp. TF02-6]RBY75477.1 universal stress protein [Geodermatophilus sp. TF02-6]
MSAPDTAVRTLRVLVGYDGSPSAVNAIEAAALLVPSARASVLHLWEPPFTSPELRQRLAGRAAGLEALGELLETEGRAEAERLTGNGVKLARAAGWEAEPLVERTFGGDGYQFARTAQEQGADLVVVGSRGLGGVRATLGSVSELVVQVSPVPVLVVPHPLTTAEWSAAASGPVVVGTDGSAGADRAVAAAAALFPGRERLLVAVAEPDDGPGPTAPDGAELITVPCSGRPGSARATAATLAEIAAQRGAGVVAVGNRGRSASRELLVGHVSRALLHCAHRPVLVVPGSRPGAA